MVSNSPDSYKICLNIIKAIQLHPVLYIPEIIGIPSKPQEFKQKVWKRISSELSLDPNWIKLKWKNLRDTYSRILKQKKKTSKETKRKKWMFEEHMSFLQLSNEKNEKSIQLTEDYINDINKEVINSKDVFDQLDDSQEVDDYSDYLEIFEKNDDVKDNDTEDTNNKQEESVSENNVEKSQDVIKNKPTPDKKRAVQCKRKSEKIESKRKKMKIIDNNVNEITSSVLLSPSQIIIPVCKTTEIENDTFVDTINKNSFDYDNSIDTFFHNIAQNVKKLPPKIQADVKMDVCKIVSEAEFNYGKSNSLQKIQKYSNMPGMIQKLVLVPCRMIDGKLDKQL